MVCRFPAQFSLLVAASLLLAPIPAASQPADATWTPPRTADGRPDLQGTWANNSATPLERPEQLEGKESFTDEELVALKAAAVRLFGGGGDAAFADGVFQAAWLTSIRTPPQMAGRITTALSGWWIETSTTAPP